MNLLKRIFITPAYHLYLLQLENYELRRFWRLLLKKGYLTPKKPWRKQISWTGKFTLILFLTFFWYIVDGYIIFLLSDNIFIPGFIILLLLFPVYLTISVLILWPFDWIIKHFIVWRAKKKLKKFPNVKIIGIAGSYGKTTAKEVILAMLSQNISVISTPENINTPLGIARLILKKLNETTQVFVVEMGEYYRGDIKGICRITPPDIAVVTGINEAHLERLKDIKSTVATIFEVAEFAKPNAFIILNADDELIKKNYQKYAGNKKVAWFSALNDTQSRYVVIDCDWYEDGTGYTCAYKHQGEDLGKQHVSMLGNYVKGDIIAGLEVGQALNIPVEGLLAGVSNIRPVEHRLQPIFNKQQNVLVIDDSYNGNPDGVREAIAVLAKFKNRRKVYITPGLVEMGVKTKQIHEDLGQSLAKVADKVVLIKNSVTPLIADGLKMGGFSEGNIIWYNSAPEAHADLGNIIKPNDVVLFQNDWGDNYV